MFKKSTEMTFVRLEAFSHALNEINFKARLIQFEHG